MEKTLSRYGARACLAVLLAFYAFSLRAELSISRVDLNDNVFHYALIQDMAAAVERGRSPLDFWMPEIGLGEPVARLYEIGGHLLAVGVYFLLLKTVSLMTIFVWLRFFSVALLPLSFFACARLLGFDEWTALAAAVVAPLVAGDAYGIEANSYLWAGHGMFPQAVSVDVMLLALGFGWRGIRERGSLLLPGFLLVAAGWANLHYGYFTSLSMCLIALPPGETGWRERLRRLAAIAAVGLLGAAPKLLAWRADSVFLKAGESASPWFAGYPWMADSYGAWPVLKKLLTGQILDGGSVVVLTVLALAGAAVALRRLRRGPRGAQAESFALSGFAAWLLLYFGRPFWGRALILAGVTPAMGIHRFVGAVQIFMVLLAAVGLAGFWRAVARFWNPAGAIVATAILLWIPARSRLALLAQNAAWGRTSLAAYETEKPDLDRVLALVKSRGGRAYAGMPGGWGGTFKVGAVPVYSFFTANRIPSVGYLYLSLGLANDAMYEFDERDPAFYRLFDVRTVVAPAGVVLPTFLKLRETVGPFRVYDAPGEGYFDVVPAVPAEATRENFFEVNKLWLQGPMRPYLALSLGGAAPAAPFDGKTLSESEDADGYGAVVRSKGAAYALFRMTYHPRWRATVDGKPERTVLLSPGFLGVPIGAGKHSVRFEYSTGLL